MFKRQYRLPSGTRISSQQTISSSFFLLKKVANNLPNSRFGFVVSKKIDKSAVVRNRTRRVLRAAIEDLLPDIKVGFDLLFVLKQPLPERTKELDTEVIRILRRIDLILSI